MSDSYKRAMDRITLSDDAKEKITKKAIKNNGHRKKKVWISGVGVAACLAIAVFSVFVMTDNRQMPEKIPVVVKPSENDAHGKKVTDDSVKYEIKEMTSLDELEASIGYDIKMPENIPEAYVECAWTIISGNTAEILYIGCGDIITYRTSKAAVLTDEGSYEITENVKISGFEVTFKGGLEKYFLASWIKNDESFLVTSICGLDKETLIEIVNSTK